MPPHATPSPAPTGSSAPDSRLDGLIRRSRGALVADPQGWPAVAAEIVVVDLPPEARARALEAGFSVVREEPLPAPGLTTTVLAPPRRLDLARAVEPLRELAPGVEATFNHVHAPAGALPVEGGALAATTAQATGARLGLIDTGIDVNHPAFAGMGVTQRGFVGAARVGAHGTAVASLMIGRSGVFAGGDPGAAILVANVYGGQATGGSSTGLANALAWLVEQHATVVNVSLVGPRNALVERAVAGARARGVTLVAAVGNDGPAGPPLYPASYEGVVGVTAVSAADRALPEAARGAQVDFAAPIVAGLIARQGAPAVTRSARDLGEPGRDPVYGQGLVGTASRVAPPHHGRPGPSLALTKKFRPRDESGKAGRWILCGRQAHPTGETLMNKTLTLATAAFALVLASGVQAQILGGGGSVGGQLGGGLGGGVGGVAGSLGGNGSLTGGLTGNVDGSRLRGTTGEVLTRAERRTQAAQARAAAAADRARNTAETAVSTTRDTAASAVGSARDRAGSAVAGGRDAATGALGAANSLQGQGSGALSGAGSLSSGGLTGSASSSGSGDISSGQAPAEPAAGDQPAPAPRQPHASGNAGVNGSASADRNGASLSLGANASGSARPN